MRIPFFPKSSVTPLRSTTGSGHVGYKTRRAIRSYIATVPDQIRKMCFGTRPADWEIRRSQKHYMSQARHLCENNSYTKRAVALMVDNILGSDGVIYRATAHEDNGDYDNGANKVLNKAWADWSKCPDVARQCSWHDIQRIILESAARDGEIFVRKIKDTNLNNYGLSIQLLESEFVDIDYNDESENIRMGIKYDDWGRVLGYWVWTEQPNSLFKRLTGTRVFIPENEIIHVFLKERASQNRGITWLAPVMKDLEDISRYMQAELQAAINGSVNVGILEAKDGAPKRLDGEDPDAADENRDLVIDNTENMTVIEAPMGTQFKKYDNGHPNNQYPAYIKAALRGVAAGLNISYNDLANDYESVNYSSLRQSALVSRDRWRTQQTWFTQTVCEEVHDDWLPCTLSSGMVTLPVTKIYKFSEHKFVCRTWDWVDPKTDIESTIMAIQHGLTSWTRACDELGIDFTELCIERANDEKIMKKYGITITFDKQAGVA